MRDKNGNYTFNGVLFKPLAVFRFDKAHFAFFYLTFIIRDHKVTPFSQIAEVFVIIFGLQGNVASCIDHNVHLIIYQEKKTETRRYWLIISRT